MVKRSLSKSGIGRQLEPPTARGTLPLASSRLLHWGSQGLKHIVAAGP
jgi:hypothetical protein